MCRRRSAANPPSPPRSGFAWLAGGGCGWAGCPAGLPEAVDYVLGLCCGLVALQWATAVAALSVSKLLKSDSSQAFLLLSCRCAAQMSRASANVPLCFCVYWLWCSAVLARSDFFAVLLHLTCRPICQALSALILYDPFEQTQGLTIQMQHETWAI